MKKSIIIFLVCIGVNIFSNNTLFAQEFNLKFSIIELEQYLGQRPPANSQQSSSDIWKVEVSDDNFIQENMDLLTINGIVVAVEYIFTSKDSNWLFALKEFIINLMEEHSFSKTIRNDVVNMILESNSNLKNNKNLFIGVTNVNSSGRGRNRNWTFSVRILDLDNR